MTALLKNPRREQLTWWLFDTGHIRVVCSARHPSMLMHEVWPDGMLHPPGMNAPSLHCGTCSESLPLRLDGWTHGKWTAETAATFSRVPPTPPCDRCDYVERQTGLSGWTRCGIGLVCPKCWREVRDAVPSTTNRDNGGGRDG